jgi:DedD protein
MDESLKARLIGAAVLVALAVLVIPELLSGRKPAEPVGEADDGRGTRTFTIELPGGGAPPIEAAPAVETPAPAAAPADREPAPAPVTVEKPPAPATASVGAPAGAPTTAPAIAAAPAAAPASAGPARGAWAVQVGAFGTPEAARRLVRELEGAGYQAFVAPTERAGKTLHRVRVGPEEAREDAARLAQRLKARGLPATVVAND